MPFAAVLTMSRSVARRTLRFALSGGPAELTADIPDGPVSAEAIFPALQALTDLVSAHAERRAETAGKTISCRKGCGACCRLLVPISEPEARHLAAVIETMPAIDAAATRTRFAETLDHLAALGITEVVLENWTGG